MSNSMSSDALHYLDYNMSVVSQLVAVAVETETQVEKILGFQVFVGNGEESEFSQEMREGVIQEENYSREICYVDE